jgi:RNA exonuclease 1
LKLEIETFRICVVNSDLEVVYSSFVMPENPITNYLTKFSGITPEMLKGVTTTLKDVQGSILQKLHFGRKLFE